MNLGSRSGKGFLPDPDPNPGNPAKTGSTGSGSATLPLTIYSLFLYKYINCAVSNIVYLRYVTSRHG